MNNEISSNLPEKDLDNAFPHSLTRLQNLVEKNDVDPAIAEGAILQKLFDRLLQSTDPAAGYQIRSSLTEIHRLLRILNRDLLFWQAAKQSRPERGSQVLATLQSIESFYQFLISHKNGAV